MTHVRRTFPAWNSAEQSAARYRCHSNSPHVPLVFHEMASTPKAPELGPDELYDALSNDRRRACLETLESGDGWMRVKQLAAAVASATTADPEDAKESIYISLIQIHLPKLASYEIIRYDEDEKVVAPGPAFDQVKECLECHARAGRPTIDATMESAVFGLSTVALIAALFVSELTSLLVVFVLLVQLVSLVVLGSEGARSLLGGLAPGRAG